MIENKETDLRDFQEIILKKLRKINDFCRKVLVEEYHFNYF